MDESEVIQKVIQKIKAKREAEFELYQSRRERTGQLFRRASYREWEYNGEFIRGKFEYHAGLPHIFESDKPAYLMSGRQLRETGYRIGQAKPVAHTYNVKASVYYLTDIRDCEPIGGNAAAKRRKEKRQWVQEIVNATGSKAVTTAALLAKHYKGWEKLLEFLSQTRNA